MTPEYSDPERRWVTSDEYKDAMFHFVRRLVGTWSLMSDKEKSKATFGRSKEYRDARLQFRRRLNSGYTKGQH